ncbi:MAG: hypothetical protein IPO36_18665 [Anaerolineales bacterium]|nr:hypothetical protein [Anaerolineales bacterium]
MPGGRIIYTDTRGWGKWRSLSLPGTRVDSKPDYLVKKNGQIIPVEVKSGRAPKRRMICIFINLRHIVYLWKNIREANPPYGTIHYENRDFAVDYTHELGDRLIDLLGDMKVDEHKHDVARLLRTSWTSGKMRFQEYL